MDSAIQPFVPPAPPLRTTPPSRLEVVRIIYRNPIELWGEPSYTKPWITSAFFNERMVLANEPGLIKHVLVDNAKKLPDGTGAPAGSAADIARWSSDGGR